MQTEKTSQAGERTQTFSGAITEYKTASKKVIKSDLREARELANTLNHIIHHQNLYIVGENYNIRVIDARVTKIASVVVESLNSGATITVDKNTSFINGNGSAVNL